MNNPCRADTDITVSARHPLRTASALSARSRQVDSIWSYCYWASRWWRLRLSAIAFPGCGRPGVAAAVWSAPGVTITTRFDRF